MNGHYNTYLCKQEKARVNRQNLGRILEVFSRAIGSKMNEAEIKEFQKMIRFFLTITSDMVGMTQNIPVQFGLATDIDPVIVVFNAVGPHRVDVRGFI